MSEDGALLNSYYNDYMPTQVPLKVIHVHHGFKGINYFPFNVAPLFKLAYSPLP